MTPFVALKDCCTVVGGATPKREIPENWGNDVPWVTPKDISKLSGPYLDDAPEYISSTGFESCATYLLPANSILLTSRAPIGNVAIAKREMCTNQGFKSLVPGDKVNYLYLYYCVRYLSPKLQSLGNGATFKEVNKKTVEEFKIPLPPVEEQKRIAAILDKADAVRRKRQQAIELADQFLQSVFLDMFGDPVTNPKGWETRKISDLGEIITGNTPSRKEKAFYGDFIEWIKSDNINTPSHFLTTAEEFLSEEGSKVGRIATKGSLLVTCIAGSKDCIGNSAIADRDVAFNQQINALIPHDKEDLFFLYAQIAHHKKLVQRASTEGMKGLVSKSKFSGILMIYPDKNLRKRFGNILEQTLTSSRKRKDAHEKADCLFTSLSQQAFKGELTNAA